MGCGSSGSVVPATEETNGRKPATVNGVNGHSRHDDNDDLPTVVLTDEPAKPKPLSHIFPAIAFEIPLDEFEGSRRVSSPPPHLQRLLQPPQNEITLPDIEEKLAEAELRRQTLLQQRAASAQKRAQKAMRSFEEMDRVDSEHEPGSIEPSDKDGDLSTPLNTPMDGPFTKPLNPVIGTSDRPSTKPLNPVISTSDRLSTKPLNPVIGTADRNNQHMGMADRHNVYTGMADRQNQHTSMADRQNQHMGVTDRQNQHLGTPLDRPMTRTIDKPMEKHVTNTVHMASKPRVREDKNI